MSYSLPPLAWLRTFEAAARLRSFAGAARELNLTPTAVSQQIRSLESSLGFALFDRLARGIEPTALANAYLPAVRKALEELAVATAGVFGTGAHEDILTLRTPVSFGALCLAPMLMEFRRAHPAIGLRVLSSIWSDALRDDHIDVEIRYGDGNWDGYDIHRLAPPVSVPVCPPSAQLGKRPLDDLLAMVKRAPIHILGCENLWIQFARQAGWPEGATHGGTRADTSVIALELVASGLGCAMISRELAARHVASNRVLTLPGHELVHDQAHFLLLPRRSHPASPPALVFAKWLIERMNSVADGQNAFDIH